MTARRADTRHLAKADRRIREEHQPELAHDDVERIIVEGKRHAVGLLPRDATGAAGDFQDTPRIDPGYATRDVLCVQLEEQRAEMSVIEGRDRTVKGDGILRHGVSVQRSRPI